MSIEQIDLESLALGVPGISPARGAGMVEAATVCMEKESHVSGVTMTVDGDHERKVSVCWNVLANPEQSARTWADPQEATENGAAGVAAVLVPLLTGLEIVNRSRKGTGFDYWLGQEDGETKNFLRNHARLEVSGIQNGSERDIKARVAKKERQTRQSDSMPLPAYVTVVEFGTPRSRVKKR